MLRFFALLIAIGLRVAFAAGPDYNVLVIHSYHSGLAWTDSVHRGLTESLNASGLNIDLHVEHMDALRFRDRIDILRDNFARTLQSKFKDQPPDAIVVSDNDALEFILMERPHWAPQVPVVFCGINGLRREMLEPHRNLTGVAEEASFGETLKIMEQLLPSRRVLVIGDQTSTFRANLTRLRAVNAERSSPVQTDVFDDPVLSHIEARLRLVGTDTMVFMMARPVDERGETIDIPSAVRAVSGASPQPVFSGWDFMLGYGIVGGKLISGEAQGHTAAQQLLRILKGAPADIIAIEWDSPNRYLFDYQQLLRFGLLDRVLPEGTVVINRPVSFYELNRDKVHAALAVFLLLLLIVAFLVIEILRRKRAEVRLHYLANHDVLTRLTNRTLLQERFEQAKSLAARHNKALALLFLDLDHFKEINDSLGHAIGDKLLQDVAERLTANVRTSDTVCRIGGDEFVILLNLLDQGNDAATIAEKVGEVMRVPFIFAGNSLNISFSIGISMYPWDGQDFADLLRNADIAMYQTKSSGRNDYRFFNEGMNAEIQRRIKLHHQLAGAIDRGELSLHIQPQQSLNDGSIVGAEALLRWTSPQLGIVSPAEFIPVAETSGLILPLGAWVFNEACRIVASWQSAGYPPIPLAVNVSVAQLRRPDFCLMIEACLARHSVAPTRIEIELTESVFMEKTSVIEANLRRLQEMGLLLAIDDFGTGYSNLGYLSRTNADRIKIDISFIRDILASPSKAEIVRAIVQIGRSLGMKAIAEGVEYSTQANLLRELGCDALQGYLLSPPVPEKGFTVFLTDYRARHQLKAVSAQHSIDDDAPPLQTVS